jgi:hypothetical protein
MPELPAARPLSTALPVTGNAPADAMPPFALPASHFAVALGWLGVGSACLVEAAPALARGAWLTSEAAAVAHCFTLGWLVTSAYGALYQLGPVAMGIEARSVRAGFVTLALHTTGSALVVAGLGGWLPRLLGAGWLLVALALAIWSWNVGTRLGTTPRAPRIGYTVLAAFGALWLGLLVAGARIGTTLGWWMVPREALVAAHVQLAAVGFGTLLVMGIGNRLLPMFLLSRTAPEWAMRWTAPLTGGGVLLQCAGWLGGVPVLVVLGGAVAGTGVALFLWQATLWFRHRARPQLDPSLRQVIAAWMHRYSPRVGEKGLPKVGDLVPVRWVRVASGAWIGGIAALALAVGIGAPLAASAGAALFALGSLVSLVLYARLVLRP